MSGSYDFEEQERIAAIRHWWEDNAKFVYAAIAATLLAIAGWRGWQYWQVQQADDAAAAAADLAKVRADPKKIGDLAGLLADRYPKSFEASEAGLVAARTLFEAGDLEGARARLEWVAKNGREEHRGIARLRLAAVLLDQKKHAEALAALDALADPAYAALAADLKGDILFAQGRLDEARAAYKLAIDKSDPRSPVKAVTEVKLGALGGQP